MKKKFFILVFTISLSLTVTGTSALASEISTETVPLQSLGKNSEVHIIKNHLQTFTNDDGFSLVMITDEKQLITDLISSGSKLTLTEIKNTIAEFNTTIISENGNGELTNLLINEPNAVPSFRGKNSGVCSAVIGGAGLAHGTLYGAAAWGLGVTGPAGWLVGAGIGALYYGGSLLC